MELIQNGPKMISHSGKKIIQDWVEKYAIDGIISDNRLGVLSKKIRLFITHQLNVITSNTTWITSKIHQTIIKKIQVLGARS
jgi:hypothetical protein